MRVISGTARRTQLVAPRGSNTRPTSDRAKEGLFNVIQAHIPGASFLDLFCGSGAIGIEALSRGAELAVFVDSSREAILACRENLKKTKLDHRAEVHWLDARQALKLFEKFDIIFIDAPYDAPIADIVKRASLLLQGGIIVIETDKAFQVEDLDNMGISVLDLRTYGRIRFYICRGELF